MPKEGQLFLISSFQDAKPEKKVLDQMEESTNLYRRSNQRGYNNNKLQSSLSKAFLA